MRAGALSQQRVLLAAVLFAVCLLFCAVAAASELSIEVSGGPYALPSFRIAGGGGTLAGGGYALNASVGQHDATVVSAQGGGYDLEGGLRPGPAVKPDAVFASSFE